MAVWHVMVVVLTGAIDIEVCDLYGIDFSKRDLTALFDHSLHCFQIWWVIKTIPLTNRALLQISRVLRRRRTQPRLEHSQWVEHARLTYQHHDVTVHVLL